MRKICRREFIRQFVIASGALTFPIECAFPSQDKRILIIGAGLSGLYAAQLLSRYGYSVKVIEARQRLGGRIWTLDEVLGHPEGGANLIGPNYGRIFDVARRLGVDLRVPLETMPADYSIDGVRMSDSEWSEWGSNPLPAWMKNLTPDRIARELLRDNPLKSTSDWRRPELSSHDLSATAFFRSKGLNDKTLSLLEINNSYGNSLESTSLLSLYRVHKNIDRAISMRQPVQEASKGNSRLAEGMEGLLKEPVVLGERVAEVRSEKGLIKARCYSGTEFEGDAAIMALPVGALREVRFSPALGDGQQTAFNQITYHKLTQAHLLASDRFWERNTQLASCWTNGALGRVFARPIPDTSSFNITIWINGDSCDVFDKYSDTVAAEKIMEHFYELYPDSAGVVKFKKLVRWHLDPLSRGAWALWRPGQILKYADLLHNTEDRIFFAGEHTAYASSGMEGAAESGERSAMQVMRSLS